MCMTTTSSTGWSDVPHRPRRKRLVLAAGMNEFIAKPLDIKLLCSALLIRLASGFR